MQNGRIKTRTLKENGKLRGNHVLEKYGPGHFAEMGRRSAAAQKAKYGNEVFKERGRKGAKALLKRDKNHMAKMRAKRWGKELPPEPNVMNILLGKK